jgi:hypothetical protein
MRKEAIIKSKEGCLKSSYYPFNLNQIGSCQPVRRSKMAAMLYRAFVKSKNFGRSTAPTWKDNLTFGKSI